MLALRLFAERHQCKANEENKSRHCYGNSNRLKVTDAGAHEKRKSGGRKASEVGDECERAGAAFRSVLFGQPERVHDEIRPAQTEQHGAHHEPRDGIVLHVEDVAESQPDGE